MPPRESVLGALRERPYIFEHVLGLGLAYLACYGMIMGLVPHASQFVHGELDSLIWMLFLGPAMLLLAVGATLAAVAAYPRARELIARKSWRELGKGGWETINGAQGWRKVVCDTWRRVAATLQPCCRRILGCTGLSFAVLVVSMALCCIPGSYPAEGPGPAAVLPVGANASLPVSERYLLITTLFRSEYPFWKRTPFKIADLVGMEIMLCSFRQYNRRDDIAIVVDGVEHMLEGVHEVAARYDARIWSYTSVRDAPTLVNGNIRRWQMLKAWTAANSTADALSPVAHKGWLMLDATDMAFQRDPFSDPRLWNSSAELHFMHDINGVPASASGYFRKMATPCFGEEAVRNASLSPVNGGMMAGSPQSLARLASLVVGLAFRCQQFSKDQHFLQMLLQLGQMPGSVQVSTPLSAAKPR